ncbi:hypothetical protein [Rhizobium yanglingense]
MVKQAAPGCDLFIIVGAPNSSNSKRLVEVALRAGAKKSILVQRAAELDWNEIGPISTLGLSAGASAPEVIVNEIIEAFQARFDARLELAETVAGKRAFPGQPGTAQHRADDGRHGFCERGLVAWIVPLTLLCRAGHLPHKGGDRQ